MNKDEIMVESIENLDFSKEISKNELLDVLKKEASEIHIYDLMLTSVQLQDDFKYLDVDYKKNFINTFMYDFIHRFNSILKDKKDYRGYINNELLQEFLNVLELEREIQKRESKIKLVHSFPKIAKIAKITAIYATFYLEIPIHPIGTLFPGGFRLKFENNEYLCPVKSKQLSNPLALCRFCVSKQNRNISTN